MYNSGHTNIYNPVHFPTERGTYILWLHLSQPTQRTIGKRGTFAFPQGWFAYVGSAFNRGGLRGRLKHHLSPLHRPHWHIDYLRAVAPIREVWYRASETVYEHVWAQQLWSLPEASIPAPRFGASDCTCRTHLIHFTRQPQNDLISGVAMVVMAEESG